MKKLFITPLIVLLLAGSASLSAQVRENQMQVKIIKNGESVLDTVFNLSEDQDPEDMKEMIRHLAGSDIKVWKDDKGHSYVMKHGDEDFQFISRNEFKQDSSGMDHEVYVWTSKDGEKVVKKNIIKGDKMIFITDKDEGGEEAKSRVIIVTSDDKDFEFEGEEIEVEVEVKEKKKKRKD